MSCTNPRMNLGLVLMTLSGLDTQGPLLREWIREDWGVRKWHRRCQSWVLRSSVCPFVCTSMCMRLEKGWWWWWWWWGGVWGQIVHGSLSLAEWSYIQAPVHLLPWQPWWPRCCHGEVDTKRRGVGTGPGVRSEGQRVKGHSQLDSTQEEARVRKKGKFDFLSLLFPFFSVFFFCSGGRRSKSGHHWTLTLNCEGEMKREGGRRKWRK